MPSAVCPSCGKPVELDIQAVARVIWCPICQKLFPRPGSFVSNSPPPAAAWRPGVTLSDDQMKLLLAMFAGSAWHKYREGRKSELTFADACRFWSITEKMSVAEARTRLDQVRRELLGIEVRMPAWLNNNNAVLSDGRSVSPEDVSTLLDAHAFLEGRFSRHLRL
jgi:hypothetical protein